MKQMYPKKGRVILHIDMNSFYASVEMTHDPSLKGKPLAIAGDVEERRGIIVTCSYEARAFGVKTTMPLWEAKRLCPNLIVRKPNFERYKKASVAMFNLLRTYTPLVEPVSIDEGYVDITSCYQLGTPLEIAKEIQKRILEQLQLPCSIGIAPNKFLAKMASDMKKPMGITILRKRDVPTVLWPLKVEEMHGIGKKTAEKLKTIQITTIKELAEGNVVQLKQLLGINGERLMQRANGIDPRIVDPEADSEFKSIGSSTTLPIDTSDEEILIPLIRELCETVGERIRKKDLLSQNIQLTIKYFDRQTITRSKKLDHYIESDDEIFQAALRLWKKHWNLEDVRLLGVTAHDLSEKQETFKQLNLFSYEEDAKIESTQKALDEIKKKFGENIIQKGIAKKTNQNQKPK